MNVKTLTAGLLEEVRTAAADQHDFIDAMSGADVVMHYAQGLQNFQFCLCAERFEIDMPASEPEVPAADGIVNPAKIGVCICELQVQLFFDGSHVLRHAALHAAASAGHLMHSAAHHPIQRIKPGIDQETSLLLGHCPPALFSTVGDESAKRLRDDSHLSNLNRNARPDCVNAPHQCLQTLPM